MLGRDRNQEVAGSSPASSIPSIGWLLQDTAPYKLTAVASASNSSVWAKSNTAP